MDTSADRNKLVTWLFGGAAVMLALAVPATLLHSNSVSQHTGNVDSGALLPIFAFVYLLPAAGLCTAAAVARSRQWPDRRAVQWLAASWLALLVFLLLVSSLLA